MSKNPENKGNEIKAQRVKLKDYYVDDIFQSFTDPERPTEEEFVMFRLQHGVDWIVEPEK